MNIKNLRDIDETLVSEIIELNIYPKPYSYKEYDERSVPNTIKNYVDEQILDEAKYSMYIDDFKGNSQYDIKIAVRDLEYYIPLTNRPLNFKIFYVYVFDKEEQDEYFFLRFEAMKKGILKAQYLSNLYEISPYNRGISFNLITKGILKEMAKISYQ